MDIQWALEIADEVKETGCDSLTHEALIFLAEEARRLEGKIGTLEKKIEELEEGVAEPQDALLYQDS